MAGFMDRLKQSTNVLLNGMPPAIAKPADDDLITSYSSHTSASNRITYDSKTSVLAPIVARISMDVAAVPIRHVIVDEYQKFVSIRKSELNERLSIRANLDQSGVAFIQDAAVTLLTEGVCALVPVDIKTSPTNGDSFDIMSIRVGSVTAFKNKSVELMVYDEAIGDRRPITLKKDFVALAYNPLASVMNEPNSTLNRLVDRLALLDTADGKLFSPNLDLIVQLPYAVKNDRRVSEAERRMTAINEQLSDSKLGIAYIDATEKVTQLNRPVTNILFETVKGLQESLHSQLGLTPNVFAGTATPEEMLSYNNRTIMPIVKALTDAMVGSFFTRTAISQGHFVIGMPDLFKMAPIGDIAEAADKLTRNEIMTSNEIRGHIGLPPSSDPEANELRNKNLNKSDNMPEGETYLEEDEYEVDEYDIPEEDLQGESV